MQKVAGSIPSSSRFDSFFAIPSIFDVFVFEVNFISEGVGESVVSIIGLLICRCVGKMLIEGCRVESAYAFLLKRSINGQDLSNQV